MIVNDPIYLCPSCNVRDIEKTTHDDKIPHGWIVSHCDKPLIIRMAFCCYCGYSWLERLKTGEM